MRGYDFKSKSVVDPVRLQSELDRIYAAFGDLRSFLEVSLDGDGSLRGSVVSERNLRSGVFSRVETEILDRVGVLLVSQDQISKSTQSFLLRAQEVGREVREIASGVNSTRGRVEDVLELLDRAQRDVELSRGRSEVAARGVAAGASAAGASASSARLSEDMAYRWAEKLDGPVYVPSGGDAVDDGFYSSKYWAHRAGIIIKNGSYFYLGPHPEAPTEGNSGEPLEGGMWYYNTVDRVSYYWNGSDWVEIQDSDPVFSVFGRQGEVIALEGDYAAYYSLLGHLHTEGEITDLDKYSQAEVDGFIGPLNAHVQDLGNPHQTGWGNLLDVPSDFPPSVHTHIETDITDLDRIRWEGEWITGAVRALNDMVRDGLWTMISLEDGNADRPAPQPDGNPEWSLADVPGWTERSHTGVVRSGMEFDIGPSPVGVQGWEVWVPALSASTSYVLFVYTYPTGQPELIEFDQIAEPLLVEDGWATVRALKSIVTSGTTVGFIIDALNSGSSSSVTGGWSRSANNNDLASDPGVGGWGQNTQSTQLRISFTDLDSVDRKTEVMGMISGTDITFADTINPNLSLTYRVVSAPVDNTTHATFSVQLTDTGASGAPAVGATTTMTASVPVPQATNYVELSGDPGPSWAAETRGTLEFDGVPQAGVEGNSYGIRVLGDRYNKSDKWDIVAYGGSAAGGGGGTVGGDTRATTGDVFPSSPVNGDLHYLTSDSPGLFVYYTDPTSSQWVQTNGGGVEKGEFVLRSGDVMTGALTVSADVSVDVEDDPRVWLRQGGAARGIFYYSDGADRVRMRKYSADGLTPTSEISLSDAGVELPVIAADIQMNNRNIDGIGRLHFDGGDTAGDYIVWSTAQGCYFYENGTLVGRIGVSDAFRTKFTQVYGSTTTSGANVHVGNNGDMVRSTSSARYKRDIRTFSGGVIDQLRPTLFRPAPQVFEKSSDAIPDADRDYLGFITEEVADVLPQAIQDDGENYDVRSIAAALVAEVQSLKARIEQLEGQSNG